MKTTHPLHIHLLGPMEIRRGTRRIDLPASKKTRALLAYLIANDKSHRRDRLTELLWDVADDPRSGLRWCLTKIRPLVDGPQQSRLIADREVVEFHAENAYVDLYAVRNALQSTPSSLALSDLLALSALFRGTFLEGLNLPDYDSYQAWLVAAREDTLQQHTAILRAIVNQLSEKPVDAIPHARQLLEIDPLDEKTRSQLTAFLLKLGRNSEARQVVDSGRRFGRELGQGIPDELADAERELSRRTSSDPSPQPAPISDSAVDPLPVEIHRELIGRERERKHLHDALERSRSQHSGVVLLITGEPGIGKTRLVGEAAALAASLRGTVLSGRSYEAEARRPYGPWIDAIRSLHPSAVGDVLRDKLAPLLTGLVRDDEQERGKDQLFTSIVELLSARAHSAPPVLLIFDDIQWCDAASAELLHYVVRMTRHRSITVLLTARSGELPDNEAVTRALRSFRRDGWMEEIELSALSREHTIRLSQLVSPSADGAAVYEEGAGNPLYTIELAHAANRSDKLSASTLPDLIEDRIARLPGPAGDVARWAAVLGTKLSLARLRELVSEESGALMKALDILDRHGLLGLSAQAHDGPAMYGFTHAVVRRAVYDSLSEPRRRLMHWRVAQVLEKEPHTPASVAEIAHHAALAGETATAARASAAAGRHCLRIYANNEALAFARSGMRFAESMPEAERTGLQIELMEISLAARRPKDSEKIAKRLEGLAERALAEGDVEHARLGFHLLSYLRWEGGDWSNAKRHSLRAEYVARGADPREQIVAMAEAARCLALLERDLGQAEALALEAKARATNAGIDTVAIPDALGMLRFHQGAWEDAAAFFQSARELALQQGDRTGEFRALEHLVVLELERNRPEVASTLCNALSDLAAKLRQGSEVPFARCLTALAATDSGKDVAREVDSALESLRMTDAKHRLAYGLLRAAHNDFRERNIERARSRSEEALRLAETLERPTEIVMARVVLMRCASKRGAAAEVKQHEEFLRGMNLNLIAAHVREAAVKALAGSV
jgi:predicted ATPase/DNA-binding SARP family transcriptional activator